MKKTFIVDDDIFKGKKITKKYLSYKKKVLVTSKFFMKIKKFISCSKIIFKFIDDKTQKIEVPKCIDFTCEIKNLDLSFRCPEAIIGIISKSTKPDYSILTNLEFIEILDINNHNFDFSKNLKLDSLCVSYSYDTKILLNNYTSQISLLSSRCNITIETTIKKDFYIPIINSRDTLYTLKKM